MEDKKKQKLIEALKSGKIKDETTLKVFEMVTDIEERLDTEIPKITDVISRMKGDEGKQGIEGKEGKRGEDGKNGLNGKDGKDGRNGLDGKNGKDGKDGISPDYTTLALEASKLTEERLKPFIPTLEQLEQDIPKLGESIRDSLELLQDEDRLDIKSIKGVDELEKKIQKNVPQHLTAVASDVWHTGDMTQNHRMWVQATEPGNPQIGDLWYDTA